MKSERTAFTHNWIDLLAVLPALFFITAALSKAVHPFVFLSEFDNYSLIKSLDIKAVVVLIIPAVEMFLGLSLCLKKSYFAPVLLIVLLLTFSLSIFLGLPLGYLERCGCLGSEELSPAFALVKNLILILLLILAVTFRKNIPERRNPWGAFTFILGGVLGGNLYLLALLIAPVIIISKCKQKHILSLIGGLILGIIFHHLQITLLILPFAACLYYLILVIQAPGHKLQPIVISILVLMITGFYLLYPATPSTSKTIFKSGATLPDYFIHEKQSQSPGSDKKLVLLLSPDCQTCQLWLPVAQSISQRKNLPVLVGYAPQSQTKLDRYRNEENLSIPVFSANAMLFEENVNRTPLLLYLEGDTVRHVFEEGRLPSIGKLEEALNEYDE
ncbi:hypothetical protein CEE37_09520 [candidate division LCP-89 bacterium B3_LCP]|uniref:Methylamine utilisation protein MauE domain-containing protein n=1 Tax=candidate division LCP-89 bacterium B3_LCP TaxID=2012998 RepID=A0A532UYE7_UNCL8|nr:MAG: hypothetical protein CEE37_09520 [candidate division LCP-89 bacterium B3_LCP]